MAELTLNHYQKLSARTRNHDLLPENALHNALLGLAGETGELCDLIKKHHFHGHPLDQEKLVSELGDILWYIAWCADLQGISLEAVASKNIQKLQRRYPTGFSHSASWNRPDGP